MPAMGRALALGLLVAGLAVGVSGLYEPSGPVALLTHRSFSKVLDSQLPVVVEFFAPWCVHIAEMVLNSHGAAQGVGLQVKLQHAHMPCIQSLFTQLLHLPTPQVRALQIAGPRLYPGGRCAVGWVGLLSAPAGHL